VLIGTRIPSVAEVPACRLGVFSDDSVDSGTKRNKETVEGVEYSVPGHQNQVLWQTVKVTVIGNTCKIWGSNGFVNDVSD
jgi:hypothetical protein